MGTEILVAPGVGTDRVPGILGELGLKDWLVVASGVGTDRAPDILGELGLKYWLL